MRRPIARGGGRERAARTGGVDRLTELAGRINAPDRSICRLLLEHRGADHFLGCRRRGHLAAKGPGGAGTAPCARCGGPTPTSLPPAWNEGGSELVVPIGVLVQKEAEIGGPGVETAVLNTADLFTFPRQPWSGRHVPSFPTPRTRGDGRHSPGQTANDAPWLPVGKTERRCRRPIFRRPGLLQLFSNLLRTTADSSDHLVTTPL
jgi:hypothetical protein